MGRGDTGTPEVDHVVQKYVLILNTEIIKHFYEAADPKTPVTSNFRFRIFIALQYAESSDMILE